MSREDMIHIVQDGIHYDNGRYTVPLPLKNTDVSLLANKNQAVKRLQWQEKKMRRNPTYQSDYAGFMKTKSLIGDMPSWCLTIRDLLGMSGIFLATESIILTSRIRYGWYLIAAHDEKG